MKLGVNRALDAILLAMLTIQKNSVKGAFNMIKENFPNNTFPFSS